MQGDDMNETSRGGPRWWRRVRHLLEGLAKGKRGLAGVATASFLETTIIPIPVEIIVAPLMAVSQKRGLKIATATLIGSVLGAVMLYFLSLWVFDDVVNPFLDWTQGHEEFDQLKQRFHEGGFWLVFIISVTPAPMQLAALAAGATDYSFWMFFTAIFLSRAIRYYGLFAIVHLLGVGYVRYFAGKKQKKWQNSA
ncbi:membrane protein [Thalassospira profundimaris]|uniref:Membrane protein n=2 Tax=Thalassospira profundimaris TaxID=502049 RepID=A0A367XF51_9PROT|nr:membrane protein [Thalassospira profundimaris]